MHRLFVGLLALGAWLMLVSLLVGAAAAIHFREEISRAMTVPPEPQIEVAEDKREPIADAFQPNEGVMDDEEAGRIKQVLEEVGQAFRRADGDAFAKLFDFERLWVELARHVPAVAGVRPNTTMMGKGIAAGMAENGPIVLWERLEIKRIRFLDAARRDAVAYVRQWDENRVGTKVRWWLTKSNGSWRVYDFENLDQGFRLIDNAATIALNFRKPEAREWKNAVDVLRRARICLEEGKVDEAVKLLESIRWTRPSPMLEGARCLVLGEIARDRGKWNEALAFYARAERANPDMPVLDAMRANVYLRMENHEEALKFARRYIEKTGDDVNCYEIIGESLTALGKPDEAADAFRSGLRDDPGAMDSLHGLRQVLPAGKKAELGDWFTKMPDAAKRFDQLVSEMLREKDEEAADAIIDAFRKVAPDNPAADFAKARLNILRKKINIALAQFKTAIPRVKDEKQRAFFVNDFLDDMRVAGKPIEAYRAAPDARAAFHRLADFMVDDDDDDKSIALLRLLVVEHRRRHADDPWVFYYSGRVKALAKSFDDADKEFAAAMKTAPNDDAREEFRSSRVFARFQAGKELDAYQNIEPRKATFDQLARLCDSAANVDRLQALVSAHHMRDPKEADAHLWQAQVHFLRQEYDEVKKILTRHRTAILAKPANTAVFADRLTRSAARLGQFDVALREAEAARDTNPLLAAAVHAMAGDVESTAAELAARTKDGFTPVTFYFDPDLGPALRTPKFQALREKYPDPVKPAAKPGA
jgi:tetratricopeptide (TPR) repeat protein